MGRRTHTALFALTALTWLGGASAVRAQGPAGEAFAVVVGSDVGGAGQERLRYAESDAVRVRDALVSVGGYVRANVTLLQHPSVADVERALTNVRNAVAERRRRGLATQLVFYYSGHARAQGLHLGAEELRLARLRDVIASVHADFTLVLLDACQSGAYARARGVEPAASFTSNSATELRTRGIALMASSTSNELSQESESLHGGFFTHHLVAGLRGAADADHDGRVTLDEVYRYAYNRTLADTARTAIGGQHVSLETDLVGHGGVPLAFPGRANVQLELPARLAGTILIESARSGTVVAEVAKVSGDALRLALVAGRYRVYVRGARTLHECAITLRAGTPFALDLGACTERDPARDVQSRGGPERAPWAFELAMGLSSTWDDAYTNTLSDFGFQNRFDLRVTGRGSFVVERRLPRFVSLVLRAQTFDHPFYARERDVGNVAALPDDSFSLTAFGLALGVRGTGLFAGGEIGVYGELSLGLGLARTRLESGNEPTRKQTELGYTLGAAFGFRYMPTLRFGLYAELGYNIAPIVRNRFDQTHDSGGVTGLFGIRMEMHP